MNYQPKVEVVPSMCGSFEAMGREFVVSASTDLVVRFVEPRYDYLRYLDTERDCMAMIFMGQTALSTLVEFGLPETRQRLKINEDEYDAWVEWEAYADMQQFEQEVADIPMDDLE